MIDACDEGVCSLYLGFAEGFVAFCSPAGDREAGESCVEYNDCGADLGCFNDAEQQARCSPYCDDDNPCADDAPCSPVLYPRGEARGFGVCLPVGPHGERHPLASGGTMQLVSGARIDQQPEAFPMPDIDDAGVDRSQIRRFLELSPVERVQQLQTMLASIERLRHGASRAGG